MSDFVGKRIVITGGAGGIGVETARAFMDQGGHVIMVDIDEERLLQAEAVLGRVRLGRRPAPRRSRRPARRCTR
jgi:NAD(P)-dependent dehydrogenase (short-subunit alcohol dehydrogenase family)